MKKLIPFVVLISMTSCASVGVQVLKNYPSKPSNCSIEVFAEEKDVKREYETVALIDSKTGSTLFDKKTVSAAIDMAKPKACEAGADAIIIMSADKKGVSYASYGEAKAIIKAIKFK